MKIYEILASVDETKPNTYDDSMKIMWLSELDGQIFRDVISTHEMPITEELDDDDLKEFRGYTDDDINSELIASFPHADMYRAYLYAKIDFANGESERYINSSQMFNAAYKNFVADYNRSNMPKSRHLRF